MASNILADLPVVPKAAERLEILLAQPDLRIERIVSSGQASPPGFWYEQAETAWVLLVSGEALLRFEDETEADACAPVTGCASNRCGATAWNGRPQTRQPSGWRYIARRGSRIEVTNGSMSGYRSYRLPPSDESTYNLGSYRTLPR